MPDVPHDLSEAFPGHAETFAKLKAEDARFSALVSEYQELDHAMRHAKDLPADDARQRQLLSHRMRLKHRIARKLLGAPI